ncbi:MAG: hypothetical protein MJZ34_05205 [Paludibacteraceae bacterium]|nr:hypothetical protein [Paludibacteraceae bacterium]
MTREEWDKLYDNSTEKEINVASNAMKSYKVKTELKKMFADDFNGGENAKITSKLDVKSFYAIIDIMASKFDLSFWENLDELQPKIKEKIGYEFDLTKTKYGQQMVDLVKCLETVKGKGAHNIGKGEIELAVLFKDCYLAKGKGDISLDGNNTGNTIELKNCENSLWSNKDIIEIAKKIKDKANIEGIPLINILINYIMEDKYLIVTDGFRYRCFDNQKIKYYIFTEDKVNVEYAKKNPYMIKDYRVEGNRIKISFEW